ncbi:MAG TPA: TonB-dependent receptor [Myxococcaceae bacterium]|nr:TonB-dependent receptor [Myxococcaceae bacterium]
MRVSIYIAWLGLGAAPASAQTPEAGTAPAPLSDEMRKALEQELGEFLLVAEAPVQTQSATKIAQRVEEAPAIVTVITRAQMAQWGYRSVADALRHTLGFYVQDDYVIPNVAVRGISGGLWSESGLIKVMIDGRSTAFRSTAGNWLGPELVPLSAIDRIEIIRGPASALYGADAFLGIVNVITRKAKDVNGADLRAAYLQTLGNGGYAGDATLASANGPWEVMVSGQAHAEDLSGLPLPPSSPEPKIPSYNRDRQTASGADTNSQVALLKVDRTFESGSVSLTGYFSGIDRAGEFSAWTQLANGLDAEGRLNENRVRLAQGYAGARAEKRFTPDLDVTLNLTYFAGGTREGDRIEVGSGASYVRRDFGYRGGEGNLEARWKMFPTLTAVAGVGLIYDREQLPSIVRVLKVRSGDLSPGDTIEASAIRQGKRNFINPGAYLQALWTPMGARYELVGGFRFDNHNIYGNQLSSRAGVVSRLRDNLYAKLLYGSAFKAPSPYLLHAVPFQAGGVIGNGQLNPQYVHTAEAELSYRPLAFLLLRTDVAYSILLDKAEFTPLGVNQVARNLARVEALSWETGLEVSHLSWKGYLSADFQRPIRESGDVGYRANLVGSRTDVAPRVQARAGILTPVPGAPLRVGLEAVYASSRRATDENVLQRGEPYALPSYLRLNASLSTVGLKLVGQKETAVRLSAYNAFDSRDADPGYSGVDYPLRPFGLRLELRQEL